MFSRTFYFGNEITHNTIYSDKTGFGFVDQEHLPGMTGSEQSLYSGGWNLRAFAKDKWKTSLSTVSDPSSYGVEITAPRFAMIFKIAVPEEGAYRITVTAVAGRQGIQNMSLFSGRRNLIERNMNAAPGNTLERSFITYTAPYIPAMTNIPCTEKAIYISATGVHAKFSKITIQKTNAPVLFIAGDSTLTDQNAPFPYYPYGSCAGWAQVLSQYFDSLAICNQAHSGMTTNCFRDDGHFDIIKERIQEKDIFMMQFGHNDQKRRNLAAFGGYLDNLRWYVQEIRKKGAYPVIVSPVSRIPFMDRGKYRSLLTAYAKACETAADELDVPFIDLHSLTFRFLCEIGEEKAHDYFMKGDITHTNDYGADKFASFVADEIKRQKMEPLSGLLSSEKKLKFLPEDDTKEFPIEPAGNGMFAIKPPYVDIEGIPQYNSIAAALAQGLLDPCVMHLHPTDMMPRAQFLMVYFKALRIAGKRPYLGTFCDLSRFEWDSSYVQTCIDENLIDPVTVPDNRFRPDDALTCGEFASFLIRGSRSRAGERNIGMEECFKEAVSKELLPRCTQQNTIISRADCYQGLVKLMSLLNNKDKALPSDTEIHPVG